MNKKRVLILGSGGREHALAAKLAGSPLVEKIYVAPGNGGSANIAENVDIAADDISKLVDFAKNEKVDIVLPGPELPLVLGITDAMQSAGIACLGPDAWASQLEGSKAFAKDIMLAANVPTASYREFTNFEDAAAHIESLQTTPVIKANGLAGGKGVVVAKNRREALEAAKELLKSHASIIAEEKLNGEEVSLLCLCDGVHCLPLPSAQDHKAAYDQDQGPNTGGMGAYSPAPVLPDEQLEEMADLVARPVLAELARRGHPFKGVLFAGLMITEDGPKVLEYNVRFGDPECQAILSRLESDLTPLLLAAVNGSLDKEKPLFSKNAAVGVVLAAGDYPGAYPKGLPIEGLEEAKGDNVRVYHSGTRLTEQGLVSDGGRVLCVTGLGQDLASARDAAYNAISKIKMPLGRYRKDIGAKGIARLAGQSDKF